VISFYDKNDSRALSSGDISANFYSKTYPRGLVLSHSSNNSFHDPVERIGGK